MKFQIKPIQVKLAVLNFIEFAVWGAYLTSLGRYLGNIGLGPQIKWFFAMQGIVSIYAAIQVKKMSGSKVWIFQLIFGILGILVGIYSFFHPILFALTITWLVGVLIGAFFIQSGFSMIFLNPEKK